MIKKTNTMNNEHLLSSINTYKDKEIKSVLQFARLLYDNYYEYLNIHDENGKKTFDDNATYTGAKNNDYRFAVDIVRKEVTKDLTASDCRNSKYLYAYCLCFGCSADYLLGFIDLPTHVDTDIYKETGLSKDAIEMLRFWKEDKGEFANSYPVLATDTNIIDLILRYEYEKREHAGLYPVSHSVFYFIGCFLSAKKYEKQIQDCLRIYDGLKWHKIQKGDILKQKNMEYLIQDMEAINSITGSGNNPDNLHIWNKENISDRRVVSIAGLYESYSKDNIFRELDKIREKQLKSNFK